MNPWIKTSETELPWGHRTRVWTNLGRRRASRPLCALRSQTLGRGLRISYLKKKMRKLVSFVPFCGGNLDLYFLKKKGISDHFKLVWRTPDCVSSSHLSALSPECTCPPPWVVSCCELWRAWWGHSWTLSWSCAGPAGSRWEPVWSTVCVHSAHNLDEHEGDNQREREICPRLVITQPFQQA